jgi:hypothetical protein
MVSEWLWMDEDQLRAECSALLKELFYLSVIAQREVQQAYDRGYTDRATREPPKAQIRNAEGLCPALVRKPSDYLLTPMAREML